ncbi:MAG: RNA polymerase sigma factor [Planctomycetes bacterium]|nr:RNA polymerase sigma factor [Planctomycetota bacterium]
MDTTAPIATDSSLLAATRRRDHAAFAALVGRHERAVGGYLRARLAGRGELDDLCQEVFVRLYAGGDPPAGVSLRAWLFGIARNVLREHLRGARRRQHAWTELCLEIEDRSGDDGRYDDAIERLPACLDGLGASARRAIDLFYGENLPMRELAAQFKRSEGAVKLLVHRARQAVKRCLDTALSGGIA